MMQSIVDGYEARIKGLEDHLAFAEDQLEVAIKDRDHAEQRLTKAQAEIIRLNDKFKNLLNVMISQRSA